MADEVNDMKTDENEEVVEEEEEKLPDYYLAEFVEAFALLDENETNMLPTDKLFQFMRILGAPGNVEDHLEILAKYDPDRTGFLDYNSCLDIMTEKWKSVDPYDELQEAFSQFDTSGYIREKELRSIMSTLGNPLNKTELKKFMAQGDVNPEGFILWDDYVHLLNPNKMVI